MNSNYTLPIVVSMAAHAAILFLNNKHVPKIRPPVAHVVDAGHDVAVVRDEPLPAAVVNSVPSETKAESRPAEEIERPAVDNPRPVVVDIPQINPASFIPHVDLASIGPEKFEPGTPGPVVVRALDFVPRAKVRVPPVYPAQARRDQQGGTVTVSFEVDETGQVVRWRIADSTNAVFNEPVLKAIEKWRFERGMKNGRPVKFQMTLPFNFNVSDT